MNEIQGKFYEVAGRFFKDRAEAQRVELEAMIPPDVAGAEARPKLAEWLVANAEVVARILGNGHQKPKRKPRKDKGVPRKRQEEAKP